MCIYSMYVYTCVYTVYSIYIYTDTHVHTHANLPTHFVKMFRGILKMLRGDRKNDEIFSQFGKCPLGQSLNLRYVYPVYPCDGSVSVTAFELSTRKKFGPSFAVAFFLIIFNLSSTFNSRYFLSLQLCYIYALFGILQCEARTYLCFWLLKIWYTVHICLWYTDIWDTQYRLLNEVFHICIVYHPRIAYFGHVLWTSYPVLSAPIHCFSPST